MLLLLRNIRRKLLKKNKVTTYLLYAIGEIILVVAGILIAVQIDGYRKELAEKKLAKVYLKRLHKEFQQNIDNQTQFAEFLSNSVANRKLVSDIINGAKYDISDEKKLNEVLSFGLVAFFVADNLTTFNELKNSGNIELLGDTTIIRKLMEFEIETKRLDKIVDYSFEIQKMYLPQLTKNMEGSIDDQDSVISFTIRPHIATYLSDDGFKSAFFTVSGLTILLQSAFEEYRAKTREMEQIFSTKLAAND